MASGATFEQMLLDALPQHQRYLVRLYANELAEKQRAAAIVGVCRVACGDEYCESCNTHKLIDLIDPEVPQ